MEPKSSPRDSSATAPPAPAAVVAVETAESEAFAAAKNSAGPTSENAFYSRVFAIGATGLLGLALYQIVAPFIGAIVWSLFIAFLLHPLHVRMTRRFGGRENLSAALLTFATFVLLIGPLAALSAAFVSQSADLVQWVQDTLAKQTRLGYRALADLPLVGPVFAWTRNNLGIRTPQIQTWIAQSTQVLPQFLAGLGGKLFLGALNTVFAFVIMLFMLFFFVRDGARVAGGLRDLIPMPAPRREALMQHIAGVTRAVVFGTGMTALVQGTLVCVAFLVTGLNSPLVFGVLAALLALLPIGGTAFVWVPAALILAAHDRWGMAIVMLAFGIMSSSVDNVLRPLLISGRAQVATLTVFIGVLGGAVAFGPIGLFLGPVLLALIIALTQFAIELRRAA